MIKIIRNANVYAPEFLGKKDVLILGNNFGAVVVRVSRGGGGCRGLGPGGPRPRARVL